MLVDSRTSLSSCTRPAIQVTKTFPRTTDPRVPPMLKSTALDRETQDVTPSPTVAAPLADFNTAITLPYPGTLDWNPTQCGSSNTGTNRPDRDHPCPSVIPSDGLTRPPSFTNDGSDFDTCISGIASVERVSRPRSILNVDPTPFAFTPYAFARMLHQKDLDSLIALGGTTALLKGLGTHMSHGLGIETFTSGQGFSPRHDCPEWGVGCSSSARSVHDMPSSGPAFHTTLDERRRIYGPNILPRRPSKTLLDLMWLAFKDKTLILLSLTATVSLALGLFQDFGTARNDGKKYGHWVEGMAILFGILIIVFLGSLNDWHSERQFTELSDKKVEREVKVIRNSVNHVIGIQDIVVGDIALFERGDIIPCDGVLLAGHNVKCDESGMTGKSDGIKKVSYDECLARQEQGASVPESMDEPTDCFVISGSKVLDGAGRYVVVAVGPNCHNGSMTMARPGHTEYTPLQVKLTDLTKLLAKIGKTAGVLLFTVLTILFLVKLSKGSQKLTPIEIGTALINIVIISLTVIVVAVPNGFLRFISLSLAFMTKRMTHDKLLVRELSSCETLANVSVVICTYNTLAQRAMNVVAGSIGIYAKFIRNLAQNKGRRNADGYPHRTSPSMAPTRAATPAQDFSLDQANLNTILSPQLRILLNEAICASSIGPEAGETMVVKSKVETALVQFAGEISCPDHSKVTANIVQSIPFSSDRKAMGAVVKLPTGHYRLYLKGASEILIRNCTHHVVVRKDPAVQSRPASVDQEIETAKIDGLAMDNIHRTIIFYGSRTLHTVALCYRDFKSWPPLDAHVGVNDQVRYEDLCRDMVLIGIMAIEDCLELGVRYAVEKCREAGVNVKMCTGDSNLTARSVASQYGIYSSGGTVMEGPEFRNLDERQMLEVVPNLQILARSSPEDKMILVEKLKELGETVGITGGSVKDVPTLETADVGFSLGISGTEIAKEASDIILVDDRFTAIVQAIMWGRCFNGCVGKFLQFYLSTQITVIVIMLITAFTSSGNLPVFSPVQLLWINIIMDTFASPAFAADLCSKRLLARKGNKKSTLFCVDMYKQIFSQSIYQITVILTLHFNGRRILHFPPGAPDPSTQERNKAIVETVVFNSLVFALIFNSINCRRLDKMLNIFEGITRNYYFLAVVSIEIFVQILVVCVGCSGFRVVPISGCEWGISILLGAASVPLGAFMRLLLNCPFEILFISIGLLPARETLPMKRCGWSTAMNRVRTSSWSLNGWRPHLISGPSPAHLRDHSVHHACASFADIPTDTHPSTRSPPARASWRSPKLRAGLVFAALSMVLTFVGVVLSGVHITTSNPKS